MSIFGVSQSNKLQISAPELYDVVVSGATGTISATNAGATGIFNAVNSGSTGIYNAVNAGSTGIINKLDSYSSSFGELLVAQMTAKINLSFAYGINGREIITGVTGTGGVTGIDSKIVVSTGGNTGSIAQAKSRRLLNYNTGQGINARFTAMFENVNNNTQAFIGFFDNENGYAIGFNNGQFSILRRYASGQDFIIPYTDFNGEGLPNWYDHTKFSVFQLQIQFLGTGCLEFYIENPETSNFILLHRIKYPNTSNLASTLNPNLPLSIHVDNKATTDNVTVSSVSMAAFIEGLINVNTKPLFGINNSVLSASGDTNILTIRNMSTYKTKINKAKVTLVLGTFTSDGNKIVKCRMLFNATITGGSWTSIDNDSVIESNNTATISNGLELLSFFIGKSESKFIDLFPYEIELFPGESLSIIMGTINSTASDLSCSINFRESQ